MCRDVGWVPDGNGQGEEASFLRRLVPAPDIRAEIRDPGTGIAPSSMINTRFPPVGSYACSARNLSCDDFGSDSCALRRADDVQSDPEVITIAVGEPVPH